MELSVETLEGIQIFGNNGLIPDGRYIEALDFVYRSILDTDTDHDKWIEKLGIKPTVLKQAHASMATLLLEAVKNNLDSNSLSPILEDCKFTPDRIESFNKMYMKNKTDLQILLSSTGYNPPHIVDVDWRLDYSIKSKQVESLHEPTYTISLKTEECDQSSANSFNFNCTQEQLQDLVGKLKDACKSVERSAQL